MTINGNDLNTYQATVTITYQYRNRSYTVDDEHPARVPTHEEETARSRSSR